MRLFRKLPLLALAVLLPAACQRPAATDPRLLSPGELSAEAVKRGLKNIYANPRAQALLHGQAPGLGLAPATPLDEAALKAPSVWRRLDREHRFDAVLLAGPAGEFQPLLTHLVESPDFCLVRIDNWGALFVRGAPLPYHPPKVNSAARDLSRDDDRGTYLAQMALRLEAAGQTAPARAYSEEALQAAPKATITHVGAAVLALGRKDYPQAIEHSRRALELDPHDLAALEITARTLAAAGATDQAWAVANELKSRASPDDMNVLFLHARLANAAHAYGAEQDSLEQLVKIAEKQNLPANDYRVYLGQCYAKQGLARPALEQLEIAARDPTLTPQQRADLATAIATVRARAGELSN